MYALLFQTEIMHILTEFQVYSNCTISGGL